MTRLLKCFVFPFVSNPSIIRLHLKHYLSFCRQTPSIQRFTELLQNMKSPPEIFLDDGDDSVDGDNSDNINNIDNIDNIDDIDIILIIVTCP